MSEPREGMPTDDYVTYEVTMRRDEDAQSLTLAGLSNTFGWNIRERVTLPTDLERDTPDSWVIADTDLRDVSMDLWGSEVYGENASGILALQREAYEYSPNWKYFYGTDSLAGLASISEVEEAARREWSKGNHPFTMNFEPHHNSTPVTAQVSAGDATRERLADYLRYKEFNNHALHGAVGKTFDVFNVVSGLVDARYIGASHVDTDFITYAALSKQLREDSGLSSTQIFRLYKRLREDIGTQIFAGEAPKTGEIIIEGRFRRSIKKPMKYDQIATFSLAKLADSYEDDATRKFLRRFA